MPTPPEISHALVLPDENFDAWLQAVRPYTQKFARVVVVRSPRGNDLNRYRNVTAVAAPRTWADDNPLTHIRRIYPQVVRIDVIQATTPTALTTILQQRISQNDRYGEKQNQPPHIFERFILEYPTAHRPMRIVRRFRNAPGSTDNNVGMDFAAQPGAKVLAAAKGIVTRVTTNAADIGFGIGQSLQVTSQFGGVTYVVTYGGLRSIAVSLNKTVAIGDSLGEAGSASIKMVVQQPGAGMPGNLPNLVDPTIMLYIQDFRLRPIDTGLRVRSLPSTDGVILGQVNPWDMLETVEIQGRALAKIGVQDEWIRIKLADGREGFAAAWFLEATRKGGEGWLADVNPVGVNLDAFHPLGTPNANQLGQIGWVRMGYNVSALTGSEDIQAAYNRYAPLAERYVRAGYKVIFTTSHQTYGEGKNEFFPWNTMNDSKWAQLIDRFAEMMGRIARQWAGKGLVQCWQVWNEQDSIPGSPAAVGMSAAVYGRMLTQVVRAIRANDRNILVITGGHTGGPGRGSQFARDSIAATPADARPDGIACHPYGRGPQPGHPYSFFGHIDDEVQAYFSILPNKPLWITEWGVLERPQDNLADVANYATSFIRYLKNRYQDRIAAMVWYAWAESMHNGYGIVDAQGKPRSPLTERFLSS